VNHGNPHTVIRSRVMSVEEGLCCFDPLGIGFMLTHELQAKETKIIETPFHCDKLHRCSSLERLTQIMYNVGLWVGEGSDRPILLLFIAKTCQNNSRCSRFVFVGVPSRSS
jgi:hypothetical protein